MFRAKAAGIPPIPIPTTKRAATSQTKDGANAAASPKLAISALESVTVRLRPTASAIRPSARLPAMSPTKTDEVSVAICARSAGS